MKITGRMLKERREALKISIAEVSISTKITARMLQAMESADMDLLPARTFLRGFVKSYASYLKMDLDGILQTFSDEMAALEPPPPASTAALNAMAANAKEEPEKAPKVKPAKPINIRVEDPPSPESRMRPSDLLPTGSSLVKKGALGLGIAGLLALIVVVYQLVQKYEREGRVEEVPPTLTKIENEKDERAKVAEKKDKPADSADAKPAPASESRAAEENKAAETKAAETKIVEAKPGETKSAETKSAETKPAETKPAEVKPGETKSADAKPAEVKTAAETKPPEVKPAEVKPAEVKPTEVKPLEAKPAPEVKPVAEKKPVLETKPPSPGPAKTIAATEPPKTSPTPPATTPAAAAPGAAFAGASTAAQEVIIEALDKVDISFRVNNGQQKHVSLQPDQVHTIKATGVVAIDLSDGGAVNIIHNGRDVGVPGDLGRPKKIQLP
jgi:cytoskeleton protein RodZ